MFWPGRRRPLNIRQTEHQALWPKPSFSQTSAAEFVRPHIDLRFGNALVFELLYQTPAQALHLIFWQDNEVLENSRAAHHVRHDAAYQFSRRCATKHNMTFLERMRPVAVPGARLMTGVWSS